MTFSLFFLFFVLVTLPCEKLDLPPTRTPIKSQIDAVKGLIERVIGKQYVSLFSLEIDTKCENYFEISGVDNTVHILASDGIGLSSGLYHYLKHFSKSSVEWQSRYISYNFPIPKEKVVKKSLVRFRYIFNTCTFGYTLAGWNFDEWERLIDWMALHGINLPLSFTGQELVWLKTFESFGLTDEEMFDYFAGSHFLPWFRMGNMRKWGGPLSMEWLNQQAELQKKILERERSFGMQPVLPAFAGFIPDAFIKKYPNCSYSRLAKWAHFNETYSENYLLDPQDPMFLQIGKTFINVQTQEFSTDHIYNVDTFNEMQPKHSDPAYLRSVADSVYKSMTAGDPQATWMLQGWLFYNERSFWHDEQIEAYLSPVPNDKMIILDLFAEEYPVFKYHKSYFGKPFIWCMLKNFGGRRALYGSFRHITTAPIIDKLTPDVTMEGTGITSEAIYMPPMIYEAFSDVYTYEQPLSNKDRSDWLENYVLGRYGPSMGINSHVQNGWNCLVKGPFELYPTHSVTNIMSGFDNFPMLTLKYLTNTTIIDFTTDAFVEFVNAINEEKEPYTDGFLYDLVDISRQFLANYFNELFNVFYVIFDTKNHDHKKVYADAIIGILSDIDMLLASNKHFLLGTWIRDAREMGKDEMEKNLFEMNARNQLTLWGPDGEINDYAKKHWGGLVENYYKNRWQIFFKYAMESSIDEKKYHEEQENFEFFWQSDYKTKFPTEPIGNTVRIAIDLQQKYMNAPDNYDLYKNEDSPLVWHDMSQTLTRNIDVMAAICDLDDRCKGFNTNGFLKNATGERIHKEGVDLYVKK